MIDELFDRSYQSGRAGLNAGIVAAALSLGAAIRNAFVVLNRIEYQSPWTGRASGRRAH
jgi:hypothetical protein